MQDVMDIHGFPNRKFFNVSNTGGFTCFHLACSHGCIDVVKILRENAVRLSFDLNKKDNMGLTAFHFACLNGHSDMV